MSKSIERISIDSGRIVGRKPLVSQLFCGGRSKSPPLLHPKEGVILALHLAPEGASFTAKRIKFVLQYI